MKPATEEERLQIYQSVLEHFPRADTPKFLPLLFVTGTTSISSNFDLKNDLFLGYLNSQSGY